MLSWFWHSVFISAVLVSNPDVSTCKNYWPTVSASVVFAITVVGGDMLYVHDVDKENNSMTTVRIVMMETSADKLNWGVKKALFVIVLLLSITSKSNSTSTVSMTNATVSMTNATVSITNATVPTSSALQVATSAASSAPSSASASIIPSTTQPNTVNTSNTTVARSKGAFDGVSSRSLYLLSASIVFATVMLF
ncbi:hypothetical protein CHS0354_003142 [Potamilus streckersoni]|uniref:Uncharacterized protein n=1 Tax=Potamilus streckersoni TaxID=2493646 RepID=A0AAE0RP66_9BIVA|nr:hypothetical protein CHS0354_003142 [Potamilus streckersoni]